MRYLLCISCLMLAGCSRPYKDLTVFRGDPGCVQQFRPRFTSALYKTQVDVVGNHLSGLLVIKVMPDSSTRVVFASEMGLTFFDFAFLPDGQFKVYQIIKKMNKKAVIKTLRKDFELILFQHTGLAGERTLEGGGLHYYAFPQEKGINYYITDTGCTHLIRAEKASATKTVVEAVLLNYSNGVPDSIGITHKNFHFTISLKRLEK